MNPKFKVGDKVKRGGTSGFAVTAVHPVGRGDGILTGYMYGLTFGGRPCLNLYKEEDLAFVAVETTITVKVLAAEKITVDQVNVLIYNAEGAVVTKTVA